MKACCSIRAALGASPSHRERQDLFDVAVVSLSAEFAYLQILLKVNISCVSVVTAEGTHLAVLGSHVPENRSVQFCSCDCPVRMVGL